MFRVLEILTHHLIKDSLLETLFALLLKYISTIYALEPVWIEDERGGVE